jgi:hypothetical protein
MLAFQDSGAGGVRWKGNAANMVDKGEGGGKFCKTKI